MQCKSIFHIQFKFMKPKMKLLLIILAIFATSRALTFNCEFRIAPYGDFPTVYSCDNAIISNIREGEVLTAVYGVHMRGKSNDDVKGFVTRNLPHLTFFPRAMENFFPNLEGISITHSNIHTLAGDELPFPNLYFFDFSWNRNLERIGGNLFDTTPQMVLILFGENNIKFVGENFMSNLIYEDWLYLDFLQNYCINQFANTVPNIQALIKNLRTNCTDIDITTT